MAAEAGTILNMTKNKTLGLIAACAAVIGIVVLVLNSASDVSTKLSDARQGASVVAVGNSFVEVLSEAKIDNPALRPTQLTGSQLVEYLNEAKDRALNGASDKSSAAAINAVTFTDLDNGTFRLISGDGSVTATVTLDDDTPTGVYYRLDNSIDS